jgi:hypothetical protein
MGASYDSTLPTNNDWVRFLTGDTDVSSNEEKATGNNARLQDEEIAALLVEEKNKYLAAARAGELIIARAKGVVEKEVDELRIKYGDNPESAYRKHLQGLREKGCENLLTDRKVFRLV